MPSEKILEAKKAKVDSLADEFRQAETLVFADYRGLTVEQDTDLRAAMRKAGVTYKVIKNSLAVRAAQKAGLAGLESLFVGPTSVAYSADDVVAPAKLVKEFATKYPILTIKGGAMSGEPMDLDGIQDLAAIPAQEVLYGQVVTGLISPIASLAMILGALGEKAAESSIEQVAELVATAAAE